jgi:RNAse (barnase) inhibitor barstar
MKEEQIILDFAGCKYITEVHWKIRDTFYFPSFYGENLSALWDMGCDYIGSWETEISTHVIIRGVYQLPKDIREYFLDKMMAVFYDIEKFYEDFKIKVKFEIEN